LTETVANSSYVKSRDEEAEATEGERSPWVTAPVGNEGLCANEQAASGGLLRCGNPVEGGRDSCHSRGWPGPAWGISRELFRGEHTDSEVRTKSAALDPEKEHGIEKRGGMRLHG